MSAQHKSSRTTRGSLPTIIAVGVMLVGALIIAYPNVMRWLNGNSQKSDMEAYEAAIADMDEQRVEAIRQEAAKYNEGLRTMSVGAAMNDFDEEQYQALLNPTGNGVMGYLSIPKLNVEVPIYHGSSDEIMRMGAGHIEGTSLPVGGPSTHAAVTAHRGEPGSSYFEDLDKLVEGDEFTVSVLGKTTTYKVDKISVVEPDEVRNLAVEKGCDQFTLLTCTPYGVNTHRLLVRGSAVD